MSYIFRIKVIMNKTNDYIIIINILHSCLILIYFNFSETNSIKYLKRHFKNIIIKNQFIKLRALSFIK